MTMREFLRVNREALDDANSYQNKATLKEYQEARQDGNHDLAERIRTCNPDLFDDEGEPLWTANS